MRKSESQDKLLPALFAAKSKFPHIAKSKQGQAGHRSFNYAPLDDIKAAIDPVLAAHGLLITESADGHNLVTTLEHAESGQWRESVMPVNEEHANMQSYGIELTYRRRYQYQLIIGILTEEDKDIRERNRNKGKDFTEERNANGTGKGPGTISPTKESAAAVAENISEKRRSELEDAAITMVEAFNQGNGMAAHEVWRGVSQADQEEAIFLWDLLSKESKLRAFLKAQKGVQ